MTKKKVKKKPANRWINFRKAVLLMSQGHILKGGGEYYRLDEVAGRDACLFSVYRPTRWNHTFDEWERAYWASTSYLPLNNWQKVPKSVCEELAQEVK